MCVHMPHTNNEHRDCMNEYTSYIPIPHTRVKTNSLGEVAHSLIPTLGRQGQEDGEFKACDSASKQGRGNTWIDTLHIHPTVSLTCTIYCLKIYTFCTYVTQSTCAYLDGVHIKHAYTTFADVSLCSHTYIQSYICYIHVRLLSQKAPWQTPLPCLIHSTYIFAS